MNISIRGVRGSIPVTGSDTAYYGGNTSCVVVSQNDFMFVLDGGSGMTKFHLPESSPKKINVLLTHLHLDHIIGMGFFEPFFDPEMEVHIWGPKSNSGSLHSRLSKYLSPPLFPVSLRDLPCEMFFHEIENSQFELGPFNIQSQYIIHPGPTVGYRVSNGKSVFTYIPDHEPMLGRPASHHEKKWTSGYNLAHGADLLLHDAQYSALEYKSKTGWGHCSMNDALEFAQLTEVKKILLTHHDPNHTDEQLNQLFGELKKSETHSINFELAAEGMKIVLP
ncbi:MAG TPA: MBL fold metallo-hydrolase [Bacteroidetes bacterium]|nr:MBL fold metallo-hydrolase [Bacteroidota bacterium]